MSDDEDVLTTLQLHDDGLQTDDNITVALASAVAVVVFIIITSGEILGILLLDFGVGQAITHT
jgi:hypothetical protein